MFNFVWKTDIKDALSNIETLLDLTLNFQSSLTKDFFNLDEIHEAEQKLNEIYGLRDLLDSKFDLKGDLSKPIENLLKKFTELKQFARNFDTIMKESEKKIRKKFV